MGIFTTDDYSEDIRWGRVLAAGALVAATSIGGCNSCNDMEYGAGTRTGVINKISKKGYIWKTYEGQMALEGLVGGNAVGANIWDFSIDAKAEHGENVEELATQLNQALESGAKVRINYREAGWPWPTRGSTDYYIQSVEFVDKE